MSARSFASSLFTRAAWRVWVLVLVTVVVSACEGVPVDDERNDKRLFPARGVMRGTVSYQGPRPCSRAGHIVGNAIIAVYRAANPPFPGGFAPQAVNFVAVPGDVLFANEPRSVGHQEAPLPRERRRAWLVER